MLPKIIHYCWFGGGPKSVIANKCIASWRELAPDFDIKEWNEHNTIEFQNKFYRDAYRKKQYAFVADIIRVSVLNNYGGVYLDLDMLLLKPIDQLLTYDFFTAYEVKDRVAFGFFGGVKGHRFFKSMTLFYKENYFNQFSLPVITHTFSGLVTKGNLNANEIIFNTDSFYALTYENKHEDYKQYLTTNSIAVHLWNHSWAEKENTDSKLKYLNNIKIVIFDYLFYSYPKNYLTRYIREFIRKLFIKLKS